MSAQVDLAVDAIQQVRDERAGDHADGAAHTGANAQKQVLPSAELGNHISQIRFLDLIRSRAPIATGMCLRSSLSSAKTAKHTFIQHIITPTAKNGRAQLPRKTGVSGATSTSKSMRTRQSAFNATASSMHTAFHCIYHALTAGLLNRLGKPLKTCLKGPLSQKQLSKWMCLLW